MTRSLLSWVGYERYRIAREQGVIRRVLQFGDDLYLAAGGLYFFADMGERGRKLLLDLVLGGHWPNVNVAVLRAADYVGSIRVKRGAGGRMAFGGQQLPEFIGARP